MEKRLVLVAVFCLSLVGSPTLAYDPCPFLHNGQTYPQAIPMPNLPVNAFKTVVRAQIMNSNTMASAYEYVSETVNVATVKTTVNGQTNTIILNYNTNEVYEVEPNSEAHLAAAGPQSCGAANLTNNDNAQMFGFGSGSHPHLFSTDKILNFFRDGSEIYRGQKTVDGVNTNWWSRCMTWGPPLNSNFTLDYYFTVPGWKTPSGLDQVPLRAEVQGQRLKNGLTFTFHHVYDYVNFEPYVDDPESAFETPPGVYCMLRKRTRSPPALSNQFYYREEISNPGNTNGGFPIISENDVWYDYFLQLVRVDTRNLPGGVSKDLASVSKGPYTMIHDYGLGVQYVIAQDINECSIDPIPTGAKGFDAKQNITRKTLGMRNPLQFFNLDSRTYLYAGQRKARGQQCDVFQAVITDLPGHGLVVYEVYFLSDSVSDVPNRGTGDTPLKKAVPMRILVWETGQLSQQYDIHDFDQYAETASAFDLSACYKGQKSVDFQMTLNVRDTAQMPVLAPYVKAAMIKTTSMSAGVTNLRLQRTRVHWDQAYAYFEGTLIGTPPAAAKYEVTKNAVMKGMAVKSVPNTFSADYCGYICDTNQEFKCTQFDFCPKGHLCILAKPTTAATTLNTQNQTCNHYQSVLGVAFNTQPTIDTIWQRLKNRVYGNEISLSLKLPDANGHVDVSVDATKLDDTQKVTFTAFKITSQVLNDASRDASTASVMTQFQVIRKMIGKGYTPPVVQGVSVDDCASQCVNEFTYSCQSFHYCWGNGFCYLSKVHPDERPRMLKHDDNCDLYFRDYTSNFEKFAGLTVLSASNTIYQDVLTASQCAKLCMFYSGFHCESFDMCTDTNTCYLGTTHYYDAEAAQIKQTPSCAHFSRSYIQDFTRKSQKQIAMRNNRVIQGVSPQQCAKLCVKEGTFTCNSFDYCGNFSECRLSDATMANTGQVTLEATAYCDVYARQYSSGGQSAAQSGSKKSNGKFSGGAMGGLAVSMIVIGLVIGLVVMALYGKFGGRKHDDGMAIAFSKHEEQSDS